MANNIPSDIRFPNGTTHVVIVDTNQYAGNFERELAAFVFGAYDEERYHGGVQFSIFEEDAEEQPELLDIKDKVQAVMHEEYGDVTNTIWIGENSKEYLAVAVFFHEPLTDREMDITLERARAYASSKKDMVIKTIRQISVDVEIVTNVKLTKA